MLATLLKKQGRELVQGIVLDRKTGQARPRTRVVLVAGLFGLLWLCCAASFFSLAALMASLLFPGDGGWLYFTLMGLVTVLLGVVVTTGNTYALVFRAKDDEFLLSLPIPGWMLLFVKMVGVVTVSFFTCVVVWVPAVMAAAFELSFAALFNCVLLLVALVLVSAVISLAIGWVIAAIAPHVRNKGVVGLVVTVLAIVAYCYARIVFGMSSDDGEGLVALAMFLQFGAWPVTLLGHAAMGTMSALGAVLVLTAALCLGVGIVMSRAYPRIMMAADKSAKARAFDPGKVRASSCHRALFVREVRRFVATPALIVNAGIAPVLMLLAAAGALVFAPEVRAAFEGFGEELPQLAAMAPVMIVTCLCFMVATSPISAGLVSIEGKTMWLVRSLPVGAADLLRAKLKLHLYVVQPPAVVCALVVGFVAGYDAPTVMMMAMCVMGFAQVIASVGLVCDLTHPNLSWTNVVAVVKQGFSVTVTLFGGWLLAAAVLVPYLFVAEFVEPVFYLVVVAAVLLLVGRYVWRWMLVEGTRLFEEL